MGTRWVTWIDGKDATVELLERKVVGGAETVRALVHEGETTREVVLTRHAERPNGQRWVVDAAGRGRRGHVGTSQPDGTRDVVLGRTLLPVRVISELDAWLGSGDDGAGSGAVTVAMPGRVVKVLAAVGAAVEKGQPVLIIEAMKMENEVKARRDGHVIALHVAEGDSVEGGKTLMEIGD